MLGRLYTIFYAAVFVVFSYAMLWRIPELIDVANDHQLFELPAALIAAVMCVGYMYCLSGPQGSIRRKIGVVGAVIALAVLKHTLDIGLNEPAAVDMRDRVVIVTGGNSGVGFATALKLSQMNATVVLACRDSTKCNAAALEIQKETGHQSPVLAMQLDLGSFKSVRTFVSMFLSQFDRLDLLLNNAGFAQARNGQLTEEGYEIGLGSMHFGHFLLTSLLKNVLTQASRSAPARVVNVASFGSQVSSLYRADFHSSLFDGDGEGDLRGEYIDSGSMGMYVRAKLANVLFTRELVKRWGADSNVVACSMHVGAVATNVWVTADMSYIANKAIHIWSGLFFRSPEQGSRTIMQCVLGEVSQVQGRYLNGMGKVVPEQSMSVSSRDDQLSARLWDVSEGVIKKNM